MSPLRVIEPKTMKPDKGREGGHKIRKMGRRRLWMSPYRPSERVLALDKTPLKRKYDDDIY